MEFGDYIRDLRERRGLTQMDVAKHIGVTRGAISQWESGLVNKKDSSLMIKLAEVLQVDINELYRAAGYDVGPENIKAVLISELEDLERRIHQIITQVRKI